MSSILSPGQDVVERMRQRYLRIRANGGSEPGILTELNLNQLPEWMDHLRLLEAQATARSYHLSLSFTHLSGLVFVLQIPSGFIPMIVTGKSESVPALFLRYLSTVNHVTEWSRSDLLDPESRAYKSIAHVRCMHKSVFERMNRSACRPSDPRFADEFKDESIWGSQHAMLVTQFAFIGLLFMHPREVGIDGSDEDVCKVLSDIAYLWRAITWMHGVTDENNMCSGSLEETIALSHAIFNEVFKPVIQLDPHPNPLGLQMAMDVLRSVTRLIRGLSGKVLMTYWSRTFNVPIPSIGPLTWGETFSYYRLCMGFAILQNSMFSWVKKRQIPRVLNRLRVMNEEENKKSEYERLLELDPSLKYSAEAVALSPCGFAIPADLIASFAVKSQHANQISDENDNNIRIGENSDVTSKRSHQDG